MGLFYRKEQKRNPAPPEVTPSTPTVLTDGTLTRIRDTITWARESVKNRVSFDVSIRTEEVCDAVEALLLRENDLRSGEEAYIVSQTVLDYLPNALMPYFGLPRETAETKFLSNGKTAEHVLCEQLDVLKNQIEKILDRLIQEDEAELIANAKFLTDRFEREAFELPSEDTFGIEISQTATLWENMGITRVETRPMLKRRRNTQTSHPRDEKR